MIETITTRIQRKDLLFPRYCVVSHASRRSLLLVRKAAKGPPKPRLTRRDVANITSQRMTWSDSSPPSTFPRTHIDRALLRAAEEEEKGGRLSGAIVRSPWLWRAQECLPQDHDARLTQLAKVFAKLITLLSPSLSGWPSFGYTCSLRFAHDQDFFFHFESRWSRWPRQQGSYRSKLQGIALSISLAVYHMRTAPKGARGRRGARALQAARVLGEQGGVQPVQGAREA